MKTLSEIMMVLLCLLLWSVILPLVGLMEIGAMIVDKVDGTTEARAFVNGNAP